MLLTCCGQPACVRTMVDSISSIPLSMEMEINAKLTVNTMNDEKGTKCEENLKGVIQDKTNILQLMNQLVEKAAAFIKHTNEMASKSKMDLRCERMVDERGKTHTELCLLHKQLWPHQVVGYQWLKFQFISGVNCILADEMGLGKTAQVIATLADLVCAGFKGPFLISVPLTTLENWVNEFKKFAPSLPVLKYHGSKSVKVELRKRIHMLENVMTDITCHPIVITTFENMTDSVLKNVFWEGMIIDEGQRLKNVKSRFFQELKKYQRFRCSLILLTGTPIQNNLEELWSILKFIIPEIFNDFEEIPRHFDYSHLASNDIEDFITKEEKDLIEKIQQVITPFLLRRTKTEVSVKLPPKKEIIIHVPLTKCQEQLSSEIIEANKKKSIKMCDESLILNTSLRNKKARSCRCLNSGKSDSSLKMSSKSKNLVSNNVLMSLRKVCLHPSLLQHEQELELSFLNKTKLIQNSSKLLIIDSLLPELERRGHKVLIFSQFIGMLDILEKYCQLNKMKYSRLDGQTDINSRETEIDKFQRDHSIFVFLLSTRAGGLGINLTAADTVIIYDSDWNPQQDIQAQDRCHRIGQTKPVVVYRLVSENSVEEHMENQALSKKKLEKLVLQEGRFSSMDSFSKTQNPITSEEVERVFQACSTVEFHLEKGIPLSCTMLNSLLDRSDMT